MPTPSKPSIMSLASFRIKTTPPVVRKSLDYIDNRLDFFHEHSSADHENNVSHLLDILKYIEAYRQTKRAKFQANTSKNLATRWGVVDDLEKQVFTRLQYESYLARKADGVKGAAKSMPAPYNLERQHFEALKQGKKSVDTNPYSMTTAKNDPAIKKQTIDYSSMTLGSFTKMMAAQPSLTDPRVYYVRLAERIDKYLLVCVDGTWYQNAMAVQGYFMYAMDKYGNLLAGPVVKSAKAKYADGSLRAVVGGVRYNHSSLVAGGDVICAGEMDFTNGKITEMNNYSGHYEPDMKRMHEAVTCLVEEYEVDLTGCLLKIMDASGTGKKVQNAMDFYKDINCAKT